MIRLGLDPKTPKLKVSQGTFITGGTAELMVHFLKRGRKMLNVGELAEPRFSQFLELLEWSNRYKQINQWK